MKRSLLPTGLNAAVACVTCSLLGLALLRIHLRVQTTLVGYELGYLKTQEARLLEERSDLKMHLAKVTTLKHLLNITDHHDGGSRTDKTFALQ